MHANAATAPADAQSGIKAQTVGSSRRRRRSSPNLTVGLILATIIIVAAVGAPLIASYSPTQVGAGDVLGPPTSAHLLGTDDIGRDILSRVLFGARSSLTVGLASVAGSTLLGVAIALMAGYWGRLVDSILMRIMDGLLAFPGLILALAMVTFLGPTNVTIVLAIAIVATPGLARISRSQVLVERRRDFVDAAIVLGASDVRVMVRHILPNIASLVVVQASLNLAFAILTEASLSFLGVGVPPPTPTWGTMLKAGYAYLQVAPWVAIAPGAAIFLAVLAFNLLGDGLRDLLSPSQR